MREKLINLILDFSELFFDPLNPDPVAEKIADHLIDWGVMIAPFKKKKVSDFEAAEAAVIILNCIEAIIDLTVELEDDHVAQEVFSNCCAIKSGLTCMCQNMGKKTMLEVIADAAEHHKRATEGLQAAYMLLEGKE